MVWVEVAIWKFSVKITSFLLLYFVRHKNILLVLTFDKRGRNHPKVALCQVFFVVGQKKINPLLRSDISDSLCLVKKILQIVSDAFISFHTAFYVTSMLLFRFFFCESPPLVSKRFKSLILFVRFCVVFKFNLAEHRGFFYGEVSMVKMFLW